MQDRLFSSSILLAHLVIIIHHGKAQALRFLLESELNKVMGSSIGSSFKRIQKSNWINSEELLLFEECQFLTYGVMTPLCTTRNYLHVF